MKILNYNDAKRFLKQFLELAEKPLNVLCLIQELGSLNKKQVASLAVVAPHPKESGKAIGYRKITCGRSNVRSKLFTASMAARNSKFELTAFYCKLVDSGKRKTAALTALMRKIIVIANARLKGVINLHSSNCK